MRVEFFLSLLLTIGALAVNTFVYHTTLSWKDIEGWMVQYFSFGNEFLWRFVLFIYVFFFIKLYIKLISALGSLVLEGKRITKADIKEMGSYLARPFLIIIPIALVTGPMWTLLGNMSYDLRFDTVDERLLHFDYLLTETYPSFTLPTLLGIYENEFAVDTLFAFYLSLAGMLSATLILLYLFKEYFLTRVAITAFLLSLLLSYPLFYLFPCQDPYNYFVRNLRNHSFSLEAANALAAYKPSSLTDGLAQHIASIETNTANDNRVPISCFPSSHAVWSFFVVYFLFQLTPFSLIVSIPWLFLLLTGGVYFAQHYVVDYVVAIPIATASIYGAYLLLQLEARYLPKRKEVATK